MYMYISVGAKMSFNWKKGEFDQGFNRLDRPVEESQPDRPVDPTIFHLCTELSELQMHVQK